MQNLSSCSPGDSRFLLECNPNTFIPHTYVACLSLPGGKGLPECKKCIPQQSTQLDQTIWSPAIDSSASTLINCIQVTITLWWVNSANPHISRTFTQGLYIPCSQYKLVLMTGVLLTQPLSFFVQVACHHWTTKRWQVVGSYHIRKCSPGFTTRRCLTSDTPLACTYMHYHLAHLSHSLAHSSVLNQAVAAVTLFLICL